MELIQAPPLSPWTAPTADIRRRRWHITLPQRAYRGIGATTTPTKLPPNYAYRARHGKFMTRTEHVRTYPYWVSILFTPWSGPS